jgi:hypothetical protein
MCTRNLSAQQSYFHILNTKKTKRFSLAMSVNRKKKKFKVLIKGFKSRYLFRVFFNDTAGKRK